MNRDDRSHAASFLASANAHSEDIDQRWQASNEQWWDWYISLAHDDGRAVPPRVDVPPLPDLPVPPLRDVESELEAPFALPSGAIEQFRREGYVKLKRVCSPAALLALRCELEALLASSSGQSAKTRFQSIEMAWTLAPLSRAFVLSRRLARIAAQLLGVDAVRLYHDSGLSKLPGCGRTPWHYDAHHYPIASENVVTLWMPLQPTPTVMGSLAFARGIDVWRRFVDLPFSKFDDSYDREIGRELRRDRVTIDDGPFELGEASFHHTRALHTAGPNTTNLPRVALSTTYLEDGARLVDAPTLVSGDYEKFMPGVGPGDPIASALNPILHRASAGTRPE